MGTKQLIKTQYGLESTHGTAVAADTMLLMKAGLPDSDRESFVPEVQVGVRSPLLLDAGIAKNVLVEGSLDDMDGAYFQVFPLLLSACLNGNVTPAEQTGSQNDMLWTFTAPQTGAEDLDSFTLEAADETQAYEIAYCLIKSLRITGDVDSGEVHVSAEFFGQQLDQTTVTGALSPPTAEIMDAKLARLYIDATWAGLGGSELASSLVSWELVIEGGAHPKKFGSAQQKFDSHGQGAINATLTLTLERNANVATEELNYRPASGYALTSRFVRLTVTGTQIGSGDNQTLQIDLAGVWDSWTPLGSSRNDNNLDVAVLKGGYDTTGTQMLAVAVTTDVASI